MLAGVVKDAILRNGTGLIGTLDDIFEAFALPLGPGDQLVAVIDLGLVVQVVVELQRFA